MDLSNVRVATAANWQEGQAASLGAGVMALGEVEAAIVVLADTPSIDSTIVARQSIRWSPAFDVVRTTSGGHPGHPVILGPRALKRVPALRGDVSARALMDELQVLEWEAEHLAPATDIDTRIALELAT